MNSDSKNRRSNPDWGRAVSGFVLLFALLGAVSTVPAQDDSYASNEETTLQLVEVKKKKEWVDSLGRETPRSSMEGFLKATEQRDYELAVEFIDFRNLPRAMRKLDHQELAEQFDFVIQRNVWVDVEALSSDPMGADRDGLPSFRDTAGSIEIHGDKLNILIQRVPADEKGKFIWKLSNATVADIPRLYAEHSYPDWLEEFKSHFPEDVTFIGLELFKWAFLLAVILVGWPILWVLSLVLTRLISKPSSPLYRDIRSLFTGPVTALILVTVGGLFLRELGLGATAQKVAEGRTLMTIFTAWLLFSIIDLMRAKRRERFIQEGRSDAAVLGRPLANTLKLFTVIIAILMWLANIGVEITALVAGLGVGGIALALAMQKPIEDLLGAISIYSQRPFVTGDLCRYSGFLGRIEEIGLRTTRMRTRANTVVSVPNSRLAYEDIENISEREKIQYAPMLRLRIDTTPDQIRQIKSSILSILTEDERVLNQVQRVQFRDFGEYFLQINIHTYINTTKFDEYLNISEELNLRVLEAVYKAGAYLAMPEGGWEQERG